LVVADVQIGGEERSVRLWPGRPNTVVVEWTQVPNALYALEVESGRGMRKIHELQEVSRAVVDCDEFGDQLINIQVVLVFEIFERRYFEARTVN